MASTLSAGFHLRGLGSLYFALRMEYMYLPRLEKIQGSVGLELEQEEEPTVVDETTAYLHCGEGLC